ncbi:MAG: hypothetical protein AAF626_11605, partial [Pseudomonadota bacterium]
MTLTQRVVNTLTSETGRKITNPCNQAIFCIEKPSHARPHGALCGENQRFALESAHPVHRKPGTR